MVGEFLAFCDVEDIGKFQNLFVLFEAMLRKEFEKFYRKINGNGENLLMTCQDLALVAFLEEINSDTEVLQITEDIKSNRTTVINGTFQIRHKILDGFWIAHFLSEIDDEVYLKFKHLISIAQQDTEVCKIAQKFLLEFIEVQTKYFGDSDIYVELFLDIFNTFNPINATSVIFLTQFCINYPEIVDKIWQYNLENSEAMKKFATENFSNEKFKNLSKKFTEVIDTRPDIKFDVDKFVAEIENSQQDAEEFLKEHEKFGTFGETPFMLIAKSSSCESVKLFWNFTKQDKKILMDKNIFGHSALSYAIFNKDPKVFGLMIDIYGDALDAADIRDNFFNPNQMLMYDVLHFTNTNNCQKFVDFCEKIFKENPEKFIEFLTVRDGLGENLISWVHCHGLESTSIETDVSSTSRNNRLLSELLEFDQYPRQEVSLTNLGAEVTATVVYKNQATIGNFQILKNLIEKFQFDDILNEKVRETFEYDTADEHRAERTVFKLLMCHKEESKQLNKIILAVIKLRIFEVNADEFLSKIGDSEGRSYDYSAIENATNFLVTSKLFEEFSIEKGELFMRNGSAEDQQTIQSIYKEFENWNQRKFLLESKQWNCFERILMDLKKVQHIQALKSSKFDSNSLEIFQNELDENSPKITNKFQDFYIAQFIIENVYFCDQITPNEGHARLKLLMDITADTKSANIRNLILNFIMSKESQGGTGVIFTDNIELVLIERFGNVFEELSQNLTAVEFLATFFSKSERIMKFLWKISENESFFIWYAKAYGLKVWHENFEKILEIAKSTLSPKNVMKLRTGCSQRGNIFYIIWRNKMNSQNEIVLQFLKHSKCMTPNDAIFECLAKSDFIEFYRALEKAITDNEKKEIFLQNFNEIFINFEHQLPAIWEEMSSVFNRSDLQKKFIGDIITNSLVHSYSFFKIFTNHFYNNNFQKYTESLFYAVGLANEVFIENFWIFITESMSLDEQKHLLLIENDKKQTVLQTAAINSQSSAFAAVLSIYINIFGQQKSIKIITKCHSGHEIFLVRAVFDSSAETCKKIVEFLKDDGVNRYVNVKKLFKCPEDDGATFFHRFEGSRRYAERMQPFIAFAKDIFPANEVEPLLHREISLRGRSNANLLENFFSFYRNL